jgi:hypothetical protein
MSASSSTGAFPMPKWIFAAAAALMLQEAVAHSDLVVAPLAAKPLTIATPIFPGGISAPAPAVRVDVAGAVLVNGEYKPTSVTSDGGERQFVEPVSDALRWWRFVPAIDNAQCVSKFCTEGGVLSLPFAGCRNRE